MRRLFFSCFLFCLLFCGCNDSPSTEIYQDKRDNTINVKDKVKEIDFAGLLISGYSWLDESNNYLFICDIHSYENLIHIINKNDFTPVHSFGRKGEGPMEITNMGTLSFNEKEQILYVLDHGKGKILSYSIDSLLIDPEYTHQVKTTIHSGSFPVDYYYINDTLCLGHAMTPRKDGPYNLSFVKWNMLSGKLEAFGYENPQVERKRTCFDVSEKENRYVEAYNHHDLLTICDLKGNLLFNIYGPKWNDRTQNIYNYYDCVKWLGDKIIASYAEGRSRGQSDKLAHLPTKFLVFDKNGKYQCTLDVGYKIQDFVCDEENKRLIINMNDTMQFGYLDLNGLI